MILSTKEQHYMMKQSCIIRILSSKPDKIIIDYKNSLAIATGIFDTAGVYIQRPEFKQGQQASTQDSLIYNFENKKA